MHRILRKAFYFSLWALLSPFLCFSQKDSIQKHEFTLGTIFQTRLHYFGRTDDLQSSALVPHAGLQLKNGLYVQSNFIFIQNKAASTSYAGTTIEGGYRFRSSPKFNGNIFYTQVLYRDKSQLPQSALKGQTGLNAAYTHPLATINAGTDIKFGKDQTDIGATAGLDHVFVIHKPGKAVAFALDPSFYVYAGTQRFVKTFIEQKDFLGIPVSQQQTTQKYDRFSILSYEASVPLVLVAGKFNASITPSFVMPQNLLEGETGQNLFYLTAGIGLRL